MSAVLYFAITYIITIDLCAMMPVSVMILGDYKYVIVTRNLIHTRKKKKVDSEAAIRFVTEDKL